MVYWFAHGTPSTHVPEWDGGTLSHSSPGGQWAVVQGKQTWQPSQLSEWDHGEVSSWALAAAEIAEEHGIAVPSVLREVPGGGPAEQFPRGRPASVSVNGSAIDAIQWEADGVQVCFVALPTLDETVVAIGPAADGPVSLRTWDGGGRGDPSEWLVD